MQLISYVFILGAAVVASVDGVKRLPCVDTNGSCCGGKGDCPQNVCNNLGKLQKNCKTCKCIFTRGSVQMICESGNCTVDFDVINAINNDPYTTWTAINYPDFDDKMLVEVIKYKLGTKLSPKDELEYVRFNKHIEYPTSFDVYQNWPQFISDITDQGWCGIDWAITIANVAADRYAIYSDGEDLPDLSSETLLPCWEPKYSETGNDSETNITKVCEGTRSTLDEIWHCIVYKKMIKGTPGKLIRERDIMYDIMTNGPVQAVMVVYRDFFLYRSGVYRKTEYASDSMYGHHSVRILGWGEENYQKYWIVANTWGPDWGENGTFRIARGVNECFIESYVLTVLYNNTSPHRQVAFNEMNRRLNRISSE